MPKIYTKRQREHALYIIQELNDYNAAADLLNIPASTLRSWWSEYEHSTIVNCRFHPVKSPESDYLAGDADAPTPAQIRDKLLRQIDQLITHPTDDPRKAYYTSLAVRSLIEQVKTINRDLGITPTNPDSQGDES